MNMEIFGYLASALVGLSLGLTGGGGSILIVPLLVYLFGVDPLLSTSYSLFVVGLTSLVGAYRQWTKKFVNIRIGLLFGLSSFVTVFIIRRYLVPVIPDRLFTISGYDVSSGMVNMVLFAFLMIAASFSMITAREKLKKEVPGRSGNTLKLLLFGMGIGAATGFLGAGGGFLLVPALVLFLGLPMKEAVGTSLMIIALNSIVGFVGDLGHFQIEWFFLTKVTSIAIAGVFLGTFLNTKLDGKILKKGFGWFVLLIGCLILLKEVF